MEFRPTTRRDACLPSSALLLPDLTVVRVGPRVSGTWPDQYDFHGNVGLGVACWFFAVRCDLHVRFCMHISHFICIFGEFFSDVARGVRWERERGRSRRRNRGGSVGRLTRACLPNLAGWAPVRLRCIPSLYSLTTHWACGNTRSSTSTQGDVLDYLAHFRTLGLRLQRQDFTGYARLRRLLRPTGLNTERARLSLSMGWFERTVSKCSVRELYVRKNLEVFESRSAREEVDSTVTPSVTSNSALDGVPSRSRRPRQIPPRGRSGYSRHDNNNGNGPPDSEAPRPPPRNRRFGALTCLGI